MTKKQVLIVDDEKNIRMTLKKALSRADYDVDTALNGEEALKMLEDKSYPVILLDNKLPGIDGIEVLEKIRESNLNSRVIMITGYGNIDSAVKTMKLGAIDFLQKPFKPDEIIEVVDEVFIRLEMEESEKEANSFEEYLNLAKTEINQRNFSRAIKHLKKVITLDSEKPEPFNLLGVIYEVKGKHQKAMKMYRAALSLDPSYNPANENLQRASGVNTKDQGKLNKASLGEEEEKEK